ncbi:MAG: peptide chain release factor 1 [Bdellovibrionaceae bacterium]|nr:peptide chain release factor 1 [Pseudobdellovibrionaceae bacterium]|tara:strand:- start:41202 stop:42278 length:1077 start_codon:yes stop_codon:yes gene_type:complete
MFSKLDEVEGRYNLVQQQLQRPDVADDQNEFRKLMKELSDLEKVVSVYQHYKKVVQELKDNKDLVANESDPELKEMAKEELPGLEAEKESLEAELKIALLPKDPNDEKNIILEIRSGAGGDEAALFAEELFRAYSLFGSNRGWKTRILDISEGNQGGVKEVVAEITGDRVFSTMKFESGVHRVQRVPKTESQGRVHTSTVTVAVIPEAEEVDVKVDPNDLRIDTYRSSGHGGQSVNTTDSAVRITHVPTGLVVTCQDGKSQLSNKEQALKVLYSRLVQIEEEKKRKEDSDQRLSQIGTGDRSERIRTYNFPQSRLTDHRIGLTVHSLNAIMDGDMNEVIDAVVAYYQAEALKRQSEQG